jgi:hypothetical protein
MEVARTVHRLFCAFDRAVMKIGMFKVPSLSPTHILCHIFSLFLSRSRCPQWRTSPLRDAGMCGPFPDRNEFNLALALAFPSEAMKLLVLYRLQGC